MSPPEWWAAKHSVQKEELIRKITDLPAKIEPFVNHKLTINLFVKQEHTWEEK